LTTVDREALLENYAAVIDEIVKAKPAAAKGRYLISVTVTTTMGPGIKIDTGRQTAGEVLAAAGLIEEPEDVEASSNGGGEADAPEPEPEPDAAPAPEAAEQAPEAGGETSAQADAIASLEERAAEAEADGEGEGEGESE
jgi:hypothetical protein